MRRPAACFALLALLSATPAGVQAQQLTVQFPLKGVDGSPIANHRLAQELAGRAALLPGTVAAGNPDGDVTLMQFYDLNCPFCRRAAQDIDELMRADKALKMVFVPYPILSSQSVEGGRVELALREMGATHFLEFRRRIYAARGTIDGARSLAVVKEMGVDPVKVIELANQPRVTETLKAHAQFASAAKLFATPSYVVAGVAIVGHPGPKTLRSVVSAVRKCKAVVC
jgi:protein-disulfide isomerase